jgi:plasmid stabilization system protein ParE
LGGDFLDEVQRVLGEITANSARYGFAVGDIREGLLNRFPYAIYYRVLPDRIRVLAVYHTARDPSGWRARN